MSLFHKTFGGLKTSYYFGHLIFGIAISALFFYMVRNTSTGLTTGSIIFIAINTLLYPYARFVYEQIIGFFLGENIFFINAIFMLIAKFTTMLLCWAMSIFIAPIGLIYLYFHHSKKEVTE